MQSPSEQIHSSEKSKLYSVNFQSPLGLTAQAVPSPPLSHDVAMNSNGSNKNVNILIIFIFLSSKT